MRALVGYVVALGACSFSPSGASDDDDDPPPAIDAADVENDASVSIDAPATADASPSVDASPTVCSTAGLDCNGGNARLLSQCATSGECIVGCRDGGIVSPDEAEAACVAWGGHLSPLASITQENCVRLQINGAIILGMRQPVGQGAPGAGWQDYTGQAIAFLRRDTGQPNDADAAENGDEQCAFSNTDPAWHDTPCAVDASARWICRR